MLDLIPSALLKELELLEQIMEMIAYTCGHIKTPQWIVMMLLLVIS